MSPSAHPIAEGCEKEVVVVGLESPEAAVVVLHAVSGARPRSLWLGEITRISHSSSIVLKTLFYQISTGYWEKGGIKTVLPQGQHSGDI